MLAALAVPEARFAEVANQVNALPEVAHNYQRNHRLNMWFVLATAQPDGIARACARIEADTGLAVQAFPKLREYDVGMRFGVGGHVPVGMLERTLPADASPLALDDDDTALVRACQAGLPRCPRPYQALGDWPYNLFAMCHGSSHQAVLADVAELHRQLGRACRGHDVLFSTAILKKTGLRS